MTTERRRRGRQRGFTMVEVLVAMVLLAIGLLTLAPMSILSIRQVGLGERNSRSAATAMYYLEDGLQQVRRGLLPDDCTETLANQDEVVRVVRVETGTIDRAAVSVEVEVTPEPRGQTPRPYRVRSYGFIPIEVDDPWPPPTAPCPPQP